MSKKTFSTAPKPHSLSDEQISAFETGGPGHDTKEFDDGAQVPTKRLTLEISSDLHTRFKTACSATGKKMASEVEPFLRKRTEELEKSAGLSGRYTKS